MRKNVFARDLIRCMACRSRPHTSRVRTVDDLEDLRTTEGRTLPGTELLHLRRGGSSVAVGTHGNILVRGPNRFLGYYRNEALNRARCTPDGFFRTGDVGFVDEAGFMTFVTRSKDIIRRGGVTITPADIETALRAHPRIADVAVIGLPDPRLGERACACVITRDGQDMSLPDITDFLRKHRFRPLSVARGCGDLPGVSRERHRSRCRRMNCASRSSQVTAKA